MALARRPLSCKPVVIADPRLLRERARLLGETISLIDLSTDPGANTEVPGCLPILPVTMPAAVTPGKPDSGNAGYILETLKIAVRGCLDGDFGAMVTGPVHKETINAAGHPFSGHTEFIAAECGVAHPVMMLMNRDLRVALVTTHLPLSAVSGQITTERLERTLTVVQRDLRERFAIAKPRLLVCGLNPHAGEGGYLGREEIDVMEPVLDRLRHDGLDLVGPVPADTAFTPASLHGIDAVVAMYHDQGLPPLKAHGFGETVNITLGLPIIRTSVDHGTAFSLAGTGRADAGSLVEAFETACRLSTNTA